jgi:D-3-phosphoglycerate dehydrogenase
MKQVLISDHGFPSIDLQRDVIEKAGFRLDEIKPNCATEDDLIQRCGQADALLVQWAPISRRVMQALLPRLRCVVRYGVGVNNIDLAAAADLDVTVANVPDYCHEEVSNHALAMILSLARRIPHDHHQIANGGWGIGQFRPIPAVTELTLGMVGFGAIARRVAAKAAPFGFSMIALDPFAPDSAFGQFGVERVGWDALLAQADVISLHCPLVPETTHLINADAIARMKPGVVIVNTCRGPVVKETDLIAALTSGKVAGAGLDVYEQEPLPLDSPLRKLPNVILTSHAASVSERAVDSLQIKAAEAARDFLQGHRPKSALVP